MSRTLLLNVQDPEEHRAVLLENGRPSLYAVEHPDARSLVGSVFKGRVLHVEPAIGAAFVDLGLERPGFLHADDVAVRNGSPADPPLRRTRGTPIEDLLAPGDDVVVQVTRDAIRHKGPTLTSYLSLAARTVVLLPSLGRAGVSRRIEGEEDRERLRSILAGCELPKGLGAVARTASLTADPDEIRRELEDLVAEHADLLAAAAVARPPALLRQESDFVRRAVRELLSRSFEDSGALVRIVVDTAEGLERARDAVRGISGTTELELHDSLVPLLHAKGVEEEIRGLSGPRASLRGGAFLVIEETEALWSVDVNSGKLRDGRSLEETALKTDLLAAVEVARHIRLRDLGGLVIVDFIDCRDPANRHRVEQAFLEELAKDPARMRVAAMSEFMVVEITRRRLRRGVSGDAAFSCPCCGGRGRVKGPGRTALAVLRDVRAATAAGDSVQVECSQQVADELAGRREQVAAIEERCRVRVRVIVSPAQHGDRFLVRRI